MIKSQSSLTFAMLEQFRGFLDKQEAKLADALLLATIPAISSSFQEPLHLHGSGHFRLSQALQVMTQRIRNLHEGKTTYEEWRSALAIINQAFWDYVEILDEAVQELFEQMNAVDLNGWSEGFYEIITSFKELLAHRIEDLIWVHRRVEELLNTYRLICKKQKNLWMVFGKFLNRFSHVLDKALLEHLFSADQSLQTQYKSFSVSYSALKTLIPEIKEKESQFSKLLVFPHLDEEERRVLTQVYRLVALNEKNQRFKTLNQDLLVSALKNIAKPGSISALFREYLGQIKKGFFQHCLFWQQLKDPSILKSFQAIDKETDFIKTLIGSYREILLREEPGLYSKTRWPFSEWIVGSEPRKTRDLLHLLYQIDSLKRLYSAIEVAIDNKGQIENPLIRQRVLRNQINEVLHEMGQPLSSKNLIQVKAERLIELLDLADELGGSLGDVRPLITDVLLKAMHFDSKYQVLNDYVRFHELYMIHQGLTLPIKNPEHHKRRKLFQSVIKHIEHWLKRHEISEHLVELEAEEAAVHESLQRLLGELQQHAKPISEDYLQMLLEYRYQFSQFFHFLRSFESEGKAVRTQFAFVDHYLDAIKKAITSSEQNAMLF